MTIASASFATGYTGTLLQLMTTMTPGTNLTQSIGSFGSPSRRLSLHLAGEGETAGPGVLYAANRLVVDFSGSFYKIIEVAIEY